MWWRQHGPAEHGWVHRSAGTTLWWSCHSLLKQWECSHSWQPCHRSLPNGHGVLPKGDRHLWPRFSPGSHQNPTSTRQMINQLQTHPNAVISKISVIFVMAQRHRVHAFKMRNQRIMYWCMSCFHAWTVYLSEIQHKKYFRTFILLSPSLTVNIRRPVRSKTTQYTEERWPRIRLCIFMCW